MQNIKSFFRSAFVLGVVASYLAGGTELSLAQTVASSGVTATTSSTQAVLVSRSDDMLLKELGQAGYTKVVRLEPKGTRFPASEQYFRVSETLDAADAKLDCSDCGNIVNVYITPSLSSVPDIFTQTNPVMNRRLGRVSMRLLVGKRIISVIAPDLSKASLLINNLKQRLLDGSIE